MQSMAGSEFNAFDEERLSMQNLCRPEVFWPSWSRFADDGLSVTDGSE
jgi:hypothetical protein